MASENNYGSLIDDYENGILVLEGESLTDYITRMGGVDYNAGGIVSLATGGTPYDSRATVEDMAKAIQTSSAGTDNQKLRLLMDYGMNTNPQITPQTVASSQEKMEKLLGLQTNPNFNYNSPMGPAMIMPPMQSTGFREGPGSFGNEGVLINGKRYMSEDEAIEDMGVETYNRFMADGGMAGEKTYHQVRDQFMPMDSESMNYANGGGVGTLMQPKRGMVDGPGGYAGFQEDEFGLQYGEGKNPYAPDVMLDVMPELNSIDERTRNISNDRAEVLQQDIDASGGRGFKAQDLDTLKSIEFVNPTLTEFELQGLKDGSITKPGNYSNSQASLNNGIMDSISNLFFTPAGAAEINPNNTFTSSVANSPYEADYMPPNRYTDFKQRVGQDEFNITKPAAEEKLSIAERLKNGINTVKNFGKDFKNTAGNFKNAVGFGASRLLDVPGMAFTGIKSLVGGMDNFKNLSGLDQQFILDQAGGNRPSKDPFGINIRSGFGNYGAYVDKQYEKDKGKVYDPVTQKFLYDRKVFNDKLAQDRIQKAEIKAAADKLALETEMNRIKNTYTDYGSGGVQDGNYDTSNMDAQGNYDDKGDPGQTE